MKLAGADVIIWLIIAVFAIVKSLGKYFNPDDETAETDAPPAPVTRPRPRPQPRPVARSVPPVARPLVEQHSDWEDPGRDLRDFMKRITNRPQPKAPVPVAPLPPLPKPVATPKPTATAAPVAQPANRTSQWVEALRDRNNIRNIIISAEIIGPPKGSP